MDLPRQIIEKSAALHPNVGVVGPLFPETNKSSSPDVDTFVIMVQKMLRRNNSSSQSESLATKVGTLEVNSIGAFL